MTRIIAVCTRAIPVEGMLTDIAVHTCSAGEQVESVIAWANRLCRGSAVLVRLELIEETPPAEEDCGS